MLKGQSLVSKSEDEVETNQVGIETETGLHEFRLSRMSEMMVALRKMSERIKSEQRSASTREPKLVYGLSGHYCLIWISIAHFGAFLFKTVFL